MDYFRCQIAAHTYTLMIVQNDSISLLRSKVNICIWNAARFVALIYKRFWIEVKYKSDYFNQIDGAAIKDHRVYNLICSFIDRKNLFQLIPITTNVELQSWITLS